MPWQFHKVYHNEQSSWHSTSFSNKNDPDGFFSSVFTQQLRFLNCLHCSSGVSFCSHFAAVIADFVLCLYLWLTATVQKIPALGQHHVITSKSNYDVCQSITWSTRMWANAQHDGHPANAAKFGWCPYSSAVSNAANTRNPLKFAGCFKVTKWSQMLVGQSSPYCKDMCGRYCCLTSFFSVVNTCLSCEHIVWQSCALVPRWWIFGAFLGLTFPASYVYHISDLHFKFALRPHHV